MELRKYQQEAIQTMFNFYEGGRHKKNAQIIMPTGTGKTETFLFFIENFIKKEFNIKFLILELSIDLVVQTAERIRKTFPNLTIKECYDGDFDITESNTPSITISTGQTLNNVIVQSNLKANLYNVVIIDECHHAKKDGILENICQYFSYDVCFGFTATPTFEKEALFNSKNIIYFYSILQAQKEGWLIQKIEYNIINTQNNLENAYKKGSYETAINKLSNSTDIRYCVWFCENIKEAADLSAVLENNNVSYRLITGETPFDARKKFIEDFKKNPKIHLINVNVLIEGIDIPEIENIIIARTINSSIRLKQIIGRGLRLSPQTNKNKLTIYDLIVGQDNFYKLYQEIHIEPIEIFLDNWKKLSEKNKQELKEIFAILNEEEIYNIIDLFKFQETFLWPELSDFRGVNENKDIYYLKGKFKKSEYDFYCRIRKQNNSFFIIHNYYNEEGFKEEIEKNNIEDIKEILNFFSEEVNFIKRDTHGIRTPPTDKQIKLFCNKKGVDYTQTNARILKLIYSKNSISFELDKMLTVSATKEYFNNLLNKGE